MYNVLITEERTDLVYRKECSIISDNKVKIVILRNLQNLKINILC